MTLWAEAGAILTPIAAKVIPAKSQLSCECLIFNIFYSPAFYTGIFNQKIVAATNNIFFMRLRQILLASSFFVSFGER
jgi:hypothetical protein